MKLIIVEEAESECLNILISLNKVVNHLNLSIEKLEKFGAKPPGITSVMIADAEVRRNRLQSLLEALEMALAGAWARAERQVTPMPIGLVDGETDAIRQARHEAYAEGYRDGKAFVAAAAAAAASPGVKEL